MRRSLLPTVLTSLRFVIAPALAYVIYSYQLRVAFWLLMAVVLSDVLDGYLARKFEAESSFGAWLDVCADFTVVFLAFLALELKGLISLRILVIIVAMFIQFVLSSWLYLKPVYDPLGKYFGALLFASLLLITVIQDSNVLLLVSITILLFSSVSMLSRIYQTSGRVYHEP